jgi:hypothetical protein
MAQVFDGGCISIKPSSHHGDAEFKCWRGIYFEIENVGLKIPDGYQMGLWVSDRHQKTCRALFYTRISKCRKTQIR